MSKKDYWVAGIFTLVVFVVAIWFSSLLVLLALAAGGGSLWFCAFCALWKGEMYGFPGEERMDYFHMKDMPIIFLSNIAFRLLCGALLLGMATRVENLF